MSTYSGVIIEESLEDKDVLRDLKIVSSRVSMVTPKHATPWLTQWTLHTFEVTDEQAKRVAERISGALDRSHAGSWYVDFKTERQHYIVYSDKIFFVDRSSLAQYLEAKNYGLSLGIPPHQMDFEEDVIQA